ncbi:NUDIX domain-containing protein [Quadrisphaera sp. DSM 44207]|uniref:NUDIX domain-containing protein n=1 Tax=Quadrisphaera sp. DSM 44207 TaxID=1881057 RepID=UPI00087FD2E3|nr:NUDIX hydrolase [Quadrisphaera sp. DSM 44207]SDQ50822.1 8-oxo-dGTP diphosphatase [Quadrisphaera sp. DSM 44207]
MASGDGNGWTTCRCGHRHWGLHGAAGLMLLRQVRPRGERASESPAHGSSAHGWQALLQLRAGWTDAGGTWGLPGGAADSHEGAAEAALRESWEETGVDPRAVRVLAEVVATDHGDWAYTVVLARAERPVHPHAANAESDEVRWVGLEEAPALPLHPGLAASWPRLRAAVASLSASPAPGPAAPR